MEPKHRPYLRSLVLASSAAMLSVPPALAAPGDLPVAPLTAAQRATNEAEQKAKTRLTSLPAQGLFTEDQLSESAKSKLIDFIIDALGLDVQVALIVPTGPWQIDGSGTSERDLTPARLTSMRKFLTDRGVDSKRIFVESRVDAEISEICEPRLDVQLVGQPASNGSAAAASTATSSSSLPKAVFRLPACKPCCCSQRTMTAS